MKKPTLTRMVATAVLLAGYAVAEGAKKPTLVSQRAAEFGVTPALASLPAEMLIPTVEGRGEGRVVNRRRERRVQHPGAGAGPAPFRDPLVGVRPAKPDAMPAPILTFDGMAAIAFAQPDTVIDVGPSHVVELVNKTRIQVFDKAGASLFGPASVRTLFIGLPAASPCRTGGDDGNPTVLHDPLADRWLVSQFEVSAFPNYQCIAISQTGDPAGAYYAYAFLMPAPPAIPVDKFQDYPHFGVWPDAYYLTTDQLDTAGTTFMGSGAFAFDRAKMIAGDPTAAYVYVDLFPQDPSASSLLPTDLDGYLPPPAGLAQLMMERRADEFGDPSDAVRLYEFVPNFANPPASTFTVRPDIVLAPFDAREPSGRADVEQFGGENLDSMADRLMVRLAYRNLGSSTVPVNSWVGNFTVNVSGVNPTSAATYQTGIRWFELHGAGTSLPTLFDQGTHNLGPIDGANGPNNWMGSIAQDNQGSLALGFSQSSSSQRADIKIAGRTGAAATGALSAGEGLFYAAAGSQTATQNRWGDYSAMAVDPADDCTFWYAQEYYATTASFAWRTRIGSFVYPGCAPAAKGTLEVTVTNCTGGAPIAGAQVTASGGFVGVTNASGVASFTTAPGDYTVTASHPGYSTGTGSATVVSGATATVGVCVTGIPVLVASGSALVAEHCTAANTAIDPGEGVTVSLCVQNTGAADTSSVVGTLQTSGGVTSPGPGETYGVIAAGGAVVCANHDFVASADLTCGASLTASLQLQDGPSNLGTLSYDFGVGGTASSPSFSENFDGVSAPTLPAGWVQAVSGATPPSPWATTTAAGFFVSAPNGAATGSSAAASGATLDSPPLAIPPFNTAELSFQNNYAFETGWDGAVLEISVDGGAFADIITAGGSWVTGGYNLTLNPGTANPLTGRPAWSGTGTAGTNGLFVTTTVDLPASTAGHNAVLRWRSGFDGSFSPAGAGWRIDNLVLTTTRPVCSVTCGAPSDLIFKDGLQTP